MKEKFSIIKKFIYFYLSIPLFVLMLLSMGAGAVYNTEVSDVEYDMPYDVEEMQIIPSSELEGEASNPDGSYPIVAKNLSKDYDILNSTNETIDENELLKIKLPNEKSPTVLVVHTHGTECYAQSEHSFPSADKDGYYGYYTDDEYTRSTDTTKNVIAIGDAFCQTLAENGISTIHCRIMHDKDDYNSAYANSRKSIKGYLEKYPSIKYVIDIHRDSLGGEGGEKIKTLSDSGSAQVMLVAGCNGNGVIYHNWKENLSLALKYKKVMDDNEPSLSRPIYLRYSRYNLDLITGSLLLEVGSCANTFEEALEAAILSAECFAKLLQQEVDVS